MVPKEETRISPQRLLALRRAAEAARSMHYAPYSDFLVLAAVETDQGVFGGSNIEVANYSLTKHGEETAILAALAAGAGPTGEWLRALYVAGGSPCGSCRQFAWEFGGRDTLVVIEDIDQPTLKNESVLTIERPEPLITRLGDLLPDAFGPADLDVR